MRHSPAAPLALRWLAALLRLAATEAATVAPLRMSNCAMRPSRAVGMIHGIAMAAEAGAPRVVVEPATPGGLDTSLRQCLRGGVLPEVPKGMQDIEP